MKPAHIYIFSHLASAPEGQQDNWKCRQTLTVKDKVYFGQAWLVKGTNAFAVWMLSAGLHSMRTANVSENVAPLRSVRQITEFQPRRKMKTQAVNIEIVRLKITYINNTCSVFETQKTYAFKTVAPFP